MRRIAFSIIAATCFIAGSAGAAITLDMIWAAPASVGGGTPTLSFVGTPDANLGGGCKKIHVGQQDGYCLQLILTIDVPWAAATSNFGWSEAGSGMVNTNVADYSFGYNNPLTALGLTHINPAYRSTGECSVVGCDKVIGSVGAAAGADSGAAGTWTLGSVNFDLTGTVVGTHEIENFFRENIDGIGNTIGELPGTGPGASGYVTLVPIPEPGTVSLLGLGIVGLVLAGRRRNR